MMDDTTNLPIPIDPGHRRVSTLERLADIPEEQIWLRKQKSARARRAYRLDVQHFMRTLAISRTAPGRPQGGDRLGALLRETEHAAASTIRRPRGIVLSL